LVSNAATGTVEPHPVERSGPRRWGTGIGGALIVAIGLAIVLAGPAAAQEPPEPSPVSPHGGFSASTSFCLQCHSIHNAEGDHALMQKESVTATCATCHGLFGATEGTGPRTDHPRNRTNPIGTASTKAAYTDPAPAGGHRIGATAVPGDPDIMITQSGWRRLSGSANWPVGWNSGEPAGPGTSGAEEGGLYCASCHTPHGSYGQMVASGVDILSAYPNHSWQQSRKDYDPANSATTTAWCITCHTRKAAEFNNHVGTCTSCHFDSSQPAAWADYPHTAPNEGMLRGLPDARCVNCHASGSLP
jgi:hypothetical protein